MLEQLPVTEKYKNWIDEVSLILLSCDLHCFMALNKVRKRFFTQQELISKDFYKNNEKYDKISHWGSSNDLNE